MKLLKNMVLFANIVFEIVPYHTIMNLLMLLVDITYWKEKTNSVKFQGKENNFY